MVFDCFTFCSEFELLEISVKELEPLNPTHVLVQANKTFTNKPKPIYNLGDDFPSVLCVNVEDMPEGGDPWTREKHQRNSIMRGLSQLKVDDNDFVIIRDIDEIPSCEAIKKYKPEMGTTALVMDKMGYWLNCREGKQSWKIAKILTYGKLKQSTPDLIRNSGQDNEIPNAGFHFSWLGDSDRLIKKLESFSHTECNTPKLNNKETLRYKRATGQSLWGEDFWEFVKIDESFPAEIRNNQQKYKHLIREL